MGGGSAETGLSELSWGMETDIDKIGYSRIRVVRGGGGGCMGMMGMAAEIG